MRRKPINMARAKNRRALNAIRHGLTATSLLLPGESRRAFDSLQESLRAELQPNGAVEEMLVERIVVLAWRLQRAARAEAGVWAHREPGMRSHDPLSGAKAGTAQALAYTFRNRGDSLERMALRYENGLERSLHRNLAALERVKAARAGRPMPLPPIVDVDLHVDAALPSSSEGTNDSGSTTIDAVVSAPPSESDS